MYELADLQASAAYVMGINHKSRHGAIPYGAFPSQKRGGFWRDVPTVFLQHRESVMHNMISVFPCRWRTSFLQLFQGLELWAVQPFAFNKEEMAEVGRVDRREALPLLPPEHIVCFINLSVVTVFCPVVAVAAEKMPRLLCALCLFLTAPSTSGLQNRFLFLLLPYTRGCCLCDLLDQLVLCLLFCHSS